MTDSSKQAEPQSAPHAIYLKDYRAPTHLVENINLVFELGAAQTKVTSRMQIRRNPASQDSEAPLSLDGSHQKLIAITLNGQPLNEDDFVIEEERLVIYGLTETAQLEVVTEIHPNQNTALEGLYVSGPMLCTQCEAEGFRRITYFPDRPDVMSQYDVTLIADKKSYPVLLSNGNLLAHGDLDDGRHWARWQDPSFKPSYLFALVAGNLEFIEDSFTTKSGRNVVLRLYTEAENIHKCDHAMASLKQAMLWDEQTYGREYDLDIYMIVAVNDFNMGAMENKGLNIFNASCVLSSSETATDQDYYNIQSIIAHEYFHNWSGNRVTCRDWFQLSLKEGFTVFRDQEFSADMNSRAVKRIDDVNVLRTYQFAEDAGPMAHPVRPNHYIEISNFYTVTVYNKGAEVVRMISNLLGAERFRKGTDLYFKRHDGQAVTTDDFVSAMQDANDVDLMQFKNWYSQAGTPELYISEQYDSKNHVYKINIQQSCPPTPGQSDKQPFHIPITIGLINRHGQALPLKLAGEKEESNHRVLELKKNEQTYSVIGIKEKPVLSVLRGFSAPVKVRFERDDEELAFLLAYDHDEFNRWDAGQQLAINCLKRLVSAIQQHQDAKLDPLLIDALRKAVQDEQLDKALLARILMLPTLQYLSDQFDIVDIEAIYQARMIARQQIAQELRADLDKIYKSNLSDAPYHFDDEAMAQRALKNTSLSYLMELDEGQMYQLGYDQFCDADNMTDQLAALANLCQYAIPQRQQALDSFYQQWRSDSQVIEKWFSVQATSRLPDTLEMVKQLKLHESFSMTNPNKVRSLIGRFCNMNPIRFHALDGGGYTFLTEQVLELNKTNQQLAARLLQPLSRWQKFDEHRQQLMRLQLETILEEENLSKDVYEVAAKILGKEE